MDAIQKDFGDFKSFKQQLTTATVAIQGSGWGWLVSFIPVGFLLRCPTSLLIIFVQTVANVMTFTKTTAKWKRWEKHPFIYSLARTLAS